jgi:hypothetical protein
LKEKKGKTRDATRTMIITNKEDHLPQEAVCAASFFDAIVVV